MDENERNIAPADPRDYWLSLLTLNQTDEIKSILLKGIEEEINRRINEIDSLLKACTPVYSSALIRKGELNALRIDMLDFIEAISDLFCIDITQVNRNKGV